MKKQLVVTITVITLAVLACTIGAPAAPVTPTQEPQPTAVPTATVQSGAPVSFQNVSFVIPEGLASGANAELIPAASEEDGGPWGVAPEHIEFTLTGYPIQNEIFQPEIHVYPAQEYAAVNSWAQSSLVRLQGILASPAQALTNDNLPTIPFNGAAAQVYAAQAKLLPFNGGNGVRMISAYAQFPAPVTRDGSFYHYEGLTADGKFMVAIRVLITLPLQSTSENFSADGVTYPADLSDTAAVEAYYQAMTDLLDAASEDSFQPTLSQLDLLIQSITITP